MAIKTPDELYASFDLRELTDAIVDDAHGDKDRLSEVGKAVHEAYTALSHLHGVLDLKEVDTAWENVWAIRVAFAKL